MVRMIVTSAILASLTLCSDAFQPTAFPTSRISPLPAVAVQEVVKSPAAPLIPGIGAEEDGDDKTTKRTARCGAMIDLTGVAFSVRFKNEERKMYVSFIQI